MDEDIEFAEKMAPLIWEIMKDDWDGMNEYDDPPRSESEPAFRLP